MNTLYFLWGAKDDVNTLQMCIRAFVTFFIALIFLRIGGVRIFSRKSSFDMVITIIFGAVLSRVIVGASLFLPTVLATLIMVLIHRVLAWVCFKNKKIAKLLKGEPVKLYYNEKLLKNNLRKATISEDDIMESLRLETERNDYDNIDTIFLETNGRISFIKKPSQKT